MNYLILKSVVETTLAHFSCKECQTKASDKDVHIAGNSGNSIQLEIRCPHCGAVGMVKAEIGMVNQSSEEWFRAAGAFNGLPKEAIEQFRNFIAESTKWAPDSLRDEDILAVRNKLKEAKSVEDLLQ